MSSLMVNADAFYQQLKSLYSIEDMLVEAMPFMIAKATNTGLKKLLALHLAETDQHKVAIGAICKALNIDPSGEADEGLKAMLEAGKQEMSIQAAGNSMDEMIIDTAIKIEQYEISEYRPVADEAEATGFQGYAQRLRLTLEEEQQSATKLKFMKSSLFSKTAVFGYDGEAADDF